MPFAAAGKSLTNFRPFPSSEETAAWYSRQSRGTGGRWGRGHVHGGVSARERETAKEDGGVEEGGDTGFPGAADEVLMIGSRQHQLSQLRA